MIGQLGLKNKLSVYDRDTLPKTLLLIGEKGSGKHLAVTTLISPLLDLVPIDLTESINSEYLGEIFVSPKYSLYIIDCNELKPAKFNILLKFLEEPPERCWIVILGESLNIIPPTILNRCSIFYLDVYTDEELSNFDSRPNHIKYLRTPGKLLTYSSLNLDSVINLCENLFLKNKEASLSNLLSVSDKIDWKGDNKDKIPPKLLFQFLLEQSLKLYQQRHTSQFEYKLTQQYVKDSISKIQFDRKRIFEKYLIELRFGGSS